MGHITVVKDVKRCREVVCRIFPVICIKAQARPGTASYAIPPLRQPRAVPSSFAFDNFQITQLVEVASKLCLALHQNQTRQRRKPVTSIVFPFFLHLLLSVQLPISIEIILHPKSPGQEHKHVDNQRYASYLAFRLTAAQARGFPLELCY